MDTAEKTIDFNSLTEAQKSEFAKQFKKEEKERRIKTAETRATLKKLEQEFAIKNVHRFLPVRELVVEDILETFLDFEPLLKLKAECYGLDRLDQNTHTTTLPDGSFSFSIGYNMTDSFDGSEGVGVEKIKQYMDTLKEDEDNDKLMKLSAALDIFLTPNPVTGMLNPRKVKELSKLRELYDSELFNEGMEIIEKAAIYIRTSQFVEGWKFITQEDGSAKKMSFRFSV